MKRIRSGTVGVDSGEVVLFSDFEHNGIMWAGEGPRQTRGYVHFHEPFAEPPMVRVGFTMWDVSNAANIRMDISADEVSEVGFSLVFKTWMDTKIARCRVGWMAIGPLPEEDEWDV